MHSVISLAETLLFCIFTRLIYFSEYIFKYSLNLKEEIKIIYATVLCLCDRDFFILALFAVINHYELCRATEIYYKFKICNICNSVKKIPPNTLF